MDSSEHRKKFLFMADSHIKCRTWTNSTVLSGDAYAALARLSAAVPEDADTLVVGGDWLDGNRPSSDDVRHSQAFLGRFRRVLYIKGNHDCAEPPWMPALSDRAEHLSPDSPAELFPGVFVFGVDWSASADGMRDGLVRIREKLSELPADAAVYIVMHTSVKEFLGFDGSYRFTADELDGMFEGFRVSFLIGDVHVRATLQRSSGAGWLHSPGSLYPLSTDRMGTGCCASLVDACSGGIEDIPCDVRDYSSLEWAGAEQFVQSAKTIAEGRREGFLPPFIRLTVPQAPYFDGQVPDVSGLDVALQVVRAGSDGPAGPDEREAPPAVGMEDAVVSVTEYSQDIQDMALALLTADDPVGMLDSWLDLWHVSRARNTGDRK